MTHLKFSLPLVATALLAFNVTESRAGASSALAPACDVSIHQIDIGDVYYVNRLLRDNDLVVVKRVNRSTGMVKVQYVTGAVDWIRPSKLYTQSGSRRVDVEETVVGTAVVAGVLWAILDPEGFEAATASPKPKRAQPRRSAPYRASPKPAAPRRSQPVAPIKKKAVIENGKVDTPYLLESAPFAPQLPGAWATQKKDWITWAERIINSELKKTIPTSAGVQLDTVRTKVVPFYSGDKHTVYLVECICKGGQGAYYLLTARGESDFATCLMGDLSAPLHTANKELSLSVSSPQVAMDYARFFCSSITGDDGVFLIVEPTSKFLARATRSKLPLRPMKAKPNADGSWDVTATFLYSNALFNATLRVHRSGLVDMLNDDSIGFARAPYSMRLKDRRRIYTPWK